MMCPHGQGGLSQCGHFSIKWDGSIFREIVRTSFKDGPYVTLIHVIRIQEEQRRILQTTKLEQQRQLELM